jgi:hypothetical protein
MQIIVTDSHDQPWPSGINKLEIFSYLYETGLLTQESIEYYHSKIEPFVLVPQSAGKASKINFGEKSFVPKPQNAEFLAGSLNRFVESIRHERNRFFVVDQQNHMGQVSGQEARGVAQEEEDDRQFCEPMWCDMSYDKKRFLFKNYINSDKVPIEKRELANLFVNMNYVGKNKRNDNSVRVVDGVIVDPGIDFKAYVY